MQPETRIVHGQNSWIVTSDCVELAITELGGHMAPVNFYADTARPIQPYYISPWQDETREDVAPDVLKPLRGNFFCMPFGGNNAWNGENHVPHGEPATGKWNLESLTKDAAVTCLTLSMKTLQRPADVTKRVSLVDGQNVVYTQHVIQGGAGKMSLGHHATLGVPLQTGALKLATSPFQLGMTNPALFSDPADGEYQSFAIGETFDSLDRVPLIWKDPAVGDASTFPQREGFTDLLAVYREPQSAPAWTTACDDHGEMLWFSLKDARKLPATAMWISNRGRHGAPWDGRNRCLGLEDVCAYFAEGLADSAAENCINRQGFPTTLTLTDEEPTTINYIEGAVRVPQDFDRVAEVEFSQGTVTFHSTTGRKVDAQVNTDFLHTGKL
ncbi:MAG: hypothetical protein ACLFVU_09895 [Phycisphaerae bacterium]